MMPRLMVEQFIFIPEPISILGILALLVVGIAEIRQGHIGRPGIAANAFLLWQAFYWKWTQIPEWFQWYLNIGTIVAIIAIVFYLFKVSLPKQFYQFCFFLYGSISVLSVTVLLAYIRIPML